MNHQQNVKIVVTMAAVARRPHVNGHGGNDRDRDAIDDDSHDLDDLHASLLQTFIAKRVIVGRDLENILGTLADATGSFLSKTTPCLIYIGNEIQPSQDEFEEIVAQINVALADFDLEIRKCLVQITGEPLWAIVFSPSSQT